MGLVNFIFYIFKYNILTINKHFSRWCVSKVLQYITCDPSIYTMDNPDITVSSFIRNSIGIQRVNKPCAFIVLNTVLIFFQMDITRVSGPRVRVLLMRHTLQTPTQLAQESDLHTVIQMHQCKDMLLVSELF